MHVKLISWYNCLQNQYCKYYSYKKLIANVKLITGKYMRIFSKHGLSKNRISNHLTNLQLIVSS